MKKNVFPILALSILLLTACGGTSPTAIPIGSATATKTLTGSDVTPLPFPSKTPRERPNEPTVTPRPPTPLPTIPTFTPTFDASTIVTVTPAAKAECPKIDPMIRPENYLPTKIDVGFYNIADKIQDYLNMGGDGQLLLKHLNKVYPDYELMGGYAFRDLTGDHAAELLYIELQTDGKPTIFSCTNGKFEKFATLSGSRDHLAYDVKIDDLNIDGIPDVIIIGTSGASVLGSTFYLYEWNGQTFSIIGQASILALRQTRIKDTDGNGTKEIILSGDNPGCLSCSNFVPQRERTVMLSWNGKNFVETLNEFEVPEYRFQAIQDADNMAIIGKYGKAVQLYKKAILNKNLEWWSSERLKYEQALADSWIPDLTLPPEPSKDQTEYPRLAAYAYYRIMLLHIVQGHELDAGTVYKTLEQKFSNNQYGRPYYEMAIAFWDAYQSTHKMYAGCAAAIQYASEHPEILTPLGSDYHGDQSHTYVPADVCPFR